MLLDDSLRRCGAILFRYRSFTPLLLIPLLWLERGHFRYPFNSHPVDEVFELGCLLVAFLGEGIRMVTIGRIPKGTSGRNTQSQKARFLNTEGMYSIVRNPLYLGNYIAFLGITMLSQCWELVLLNTLLFFFAYLPIILVEERFLLQTFGETYREYASRVPCVVPRLRLWKPPTRPWSWRMVIRREYDTIFSIILAYVCITHFRDYTISGTFTWDMDILAFGAISFVVWAVLKILKKYTNVLKEPPLPSSQNLCCEK